MQYCLTCLFNTKPELDFRSPDSWSRSVFTAYTMEREFAVQWEPSALPAKGQVLVRGRSGHMVEKVDNLLTHMAW